MSEEEDFLHLLELERAELFKELVAKRQERDELTVEIRRLTKRMTLLGRYLELGEGEAPNA